jgi:hypothetical protein
MCDSHSNVNGAQFFVLREKYTDNYSGCVSSTPTSAKKCKNRQLHGAGTPFASNYFTFTCFFLKFERLLNHPLSLACNVAELILR